MTIVKNVSRGPRGLHLADGSLLQLEPGQSSPDVEITDGELTAARKTGWFLFDGEQGTELKLSLGTTEAEKLIADAREEFERRWKEVNDQLNAEKLRADDAEDKLEKALAEIDSLKAQLAAFDHDGDGKPGGVAATEPATDDPVKAALGLLDPTKDDDWTAAGLPAVDAVAALAGGKVTRQQIQTIAPDLTRDTAKRG